MLTQEATPAQIGAFLIAHRIKRPVPAELAGLLDAYAELGPVNFLPSTATSPLQCWAVPTMAALAPPRSPPLLR